MGICLDTDKKNNTEELELADRRPAWVTEVSPSVTQEGKSSFKNEGGHVTFRSPQVPVIFVLGGPGSGKVTHCDSLVAEKRGVVHINMTDLLQQYIVSNGENKDFNQLSSRVVAEVLMLEMKMSPAATTMLVSGYPRSMRDVVEYTDKIKSVSGVILLNWKQKSLERQIEYGAKFGHVVLDLARMELNNFYKNVIPVAEFYDQRKVLTTIDGERVPQEVYNDFRITVMRVIGNYNDGDQRQLMNTTKPSETVINVQSVPSHNRTVTEPTTTTTVSIHPQPLDGYPTFVYIIGGPGSNKAALINKTLRRVAQWGHISMGEILRGAVDSRQFSLAEAEQLRNTIAAGEMVDQSIVMQLLDQAVLTNIKCKGIIVDGFPRSMLQLETFETKYDQHPRTILLDCSKLQLSRGRWDDSIAAFRRRLEIFRESTLPMLKVLDTEHRLIMIDGDTETPEVQEQFTIDLLEMIDLAQEDLVAEYGESSRSSNVVVNLEAALLQDLEDDILAAKDESTTNKAKPLQVNGYGPPRDRKGRTGLGGNVTSVTHGNFADQDFILPTENTIRTHAQIESYLDRK